MSDTPETDAAALHDGTVVSDDFARKLERERDEARDTVLRLRKQRAISRSFGEQMERERDEARRLIAAAKESLNAIHVEVGGWIAAMMKGGK
jgi:hypothetical protein